jgi:HAD superfamily hydrolase (TIGR01490 family)
MRQAMSTQPEKWSIFDFDRTLTRRGSWSLFLLFSAKRRAPLRLILTPFLLTAMAAYKLNLFSRKRLKEIMHAAILGRSLSPAAVADLAEAYADHCIKTNILDQAVARIRSEEAEGRTVVIASAAHEFYLIPIARRLGISHVIGTVSQCHEGHLLPTISGDNCFAQSKLDRIQMDFANRQINRADCHIRFFSDDITDLPSFLWSDEPIAVNASSGLARHALSQGWRSLDWR